MKKSFSVLLVLMLILSAFSLPTLANIDTPGIRPNAESVPGLYNNWTNLTADQLWGLNTCLVFSYTAWYAPYDHLQACYTFNTTSGAFADFNHSTLVAWSELYNSTNDTKYLSTQNTNSFTMGDLLNLTSDVHIVYCNRDIIDGNTVIYDSSYDNTYLAPVSVSYTGIVGGRYDYTFAQVSPFIINVSNYDGERDVLGYRLGASASGKFYTDVNVENLNPGANVVNISNNWITYIQSLFNNHSFYYLLTVYNHGNVISSVSFGVNKNAIAPNNTGTSNPQTTPVSGKVSTDSGFSWLSPETAVFDPVEMKVTLPTSSGTPVVKNVDSFAYDPLTSTYTTNNSDGSTSIISQGNDTIKVTQTDPNGTSQQLTYYVYSGVTDASGNPVQEDPADNTSILSKIREISSAIDVFSELIASFVNGLVNIFSSCIDAFRELITGSSKVAGFFSSLLGFLPTEVITIISSGFIVLMFFSIIRIIRG